MIGFMPQIYPDELVYSWFTRYYLKSGYLAYRDVFKELYTNYLIKPSIEFINPLNDTANKVINSIISRGELIANHTMLEYYTRFLPLEKRKLAFDTMVKDGVSERRYIGLTPDRNGKKRYLRYCPLCIAEDRNKYGEAYWHRVHQVRELAICPTHFCYLINSQIPISARGAPRLFPLDAECCSVEIRMEKDMVAQNLASYICKIMSQPMNFSNDVPVDMFLNSKLDNTDYISPRGQQRNMEKLYDGYVQFYGVNNIMELWQMEKLFCGQRLRFYEICQVAMFLGIKVNELSNMVLPIVKREQRFDETISKLRSEGHTYKEIADRMNVSLDTVKNTAYKKYSTHQRKKPIKKFKPGSKALNYDELDEKLLPMVKEIVYKLYFGNGGRPQKVTVYRVERELKLPSKQLQRLPRCLTLITSVAETYEEYWAREIIWAVNELKNGCGMVNYKQIRLLTNLNHLNFNTGLDILQKLDLNMYAYLKEKLD